MQKMASYGFSVTGSIHDFELRYISFEDVIADWFSQKGRLIGDGNEGHIILRDNRIATITQSELIASSGRMKTIEITEPVNSGSFSTQLQFGFYANEFSVTCNMYAMAAAERISPVKFETRCPKVVRDIIKKWGDWSIDGTPILDAPIDYVGEKGGKAIEAIIWNPERRIPVVLVSSDEYGPLAEDIAENINYDLSGVAIVATIDQEASWYLTKSKGKQWSCYYGAIRLYWPISQSLNEPFSHPLWLKQSLLYRYQSEENATEQLRAQLRSIIFESTRFSSAIPQVFQNISSELEIEANKKSEEIAEQSNQWKDLAVERFGKIRELNSKINELTSKIDELEAINRNLQLAAEWRNNKDGDIVQQPSELPPSTIIDAVIAGKATCSNLIFGDKVDDGPLDMDESAGPPTKVLFCLQTLDKLAAEYKEKNGSIGTDVLRWLCNNGVEASGESDTTLNDPVKMRKRTWPTPYGNHKFEKHMKPNDGTSPDKCVRIYFETFIDNFEVVVGWVGRHPDK